MFQCSSTPFENKSSNFLRFRIFAMKLFSSFVYHPYKVVPILPSSSLQLNFENEALQYWKIFFDFGYYLFLVPFRFEWNQVKGVYSMKTSQIQKICCFISTLFGGLYYILKIRQKYTSAANVQNRNPAMYFELAYYFCDTLYLLIMFAAFGQKGHEISQVFKELQEANNRFYSNPLEHFKTKFQSKLLCWLCLSTLVVYLLEVNYDSNNPETIIAHFEKDSAAVFKLFWNPSSSKLNAGSEENHPPILFTILSIFSNCLERILNAFSDILFVMTVLLFRNLVNNFRHSLIESRDIKATEVLEHYRWLRNITCKINNAMSLIIGSFIVGNLPFYATNVLDTFRDSCNIFMRLRYLFYCTYFFPALFLAAKSSKEVEEIKAWVYKDENHSQLDDQTLGVVLHEVNSYAVGLSSYGCLTVNYGLFGSIVSIILTYALLKTQFQGPQASASGAFPLQTLTFTQEKLLN